MKRTLHHHLLLLLAVAAPSLAGCYSVRFETRLPSGGAVHEERANFFLWGMAGHKDVDLDAACPAGAHAWRSKTGFGDGLLAAITLGIYVPATIEIECAPEGR